MGSGRGRVSKAQKLTTDDTFIHFCLCCLYDMVE